MVNGLGQQQQQQQQQQQWAAYMQQQSYMQQQPSMQHQQQFAAARAACMAQAMMMMKAQAKKHKKDKKQKKKEKKKKRKRSTSSGSDSEEQEDAGTVATDSRAMKRRRTGEHAKSGQDSNGLDEWLQGSSVLPQSPSVSSHGLTADNVNGLDALIIARQNDGEAHSKRARIEQAHAKDPSTSTAGETPAKSGEMVQTGVTGGAAEPWEEPRSKTGLKLIGEKAPEHLGWQYVLKDESRRCFVGLNKRILEKIGCPPFFETARDNTDWIHPEEAHGRKIPRKTAWMVSAGCNCSYCYGRFFVDPQEYPPWMKKLMQWIMPCCGIYDPSDWPNSCNLNLYEEGNMSVGWHADDEQLFQGKFRDCTIISLSLGSTRSFEVRANYSEDSSQNVNLMLGDGDLCTMEGMVQKYFQHRVPRENSTGPRINLTWRWILKHTPRCPIARERG
eukprot:TRINITY_DN7188_c0_g1_i1.p1 TRINITY_DN7188_c0_g1~~TRINITY_DN7188_c0_g1_i1.p1  ORF type:complete len:469 (+),score=98.64 TRINITY_DN7188_c0_g1_i1:78-1409(+)